MLKNIPFYKMNEVKEMDNQMFIEKCKCVVVDYVNKNLDVTDNKEISDNDVYVVWCCKTLQNNKALISTSLFDGMYYEITYNGDKKELYFDVYKKWENRAIKI